MRKKIKFEILNILENMIKEIEDVCNGQLSVDFCAELQSLLITIGNTIENEYGEDFFIVHMLEDCLDIIYEISIRIEKIDEAKYYKEKLIEKIKDIKISIKNDVPNTYEILFMPYNVTMWDALESVYEAAKNAENCNVTVMPVPYYNITPNGEIVDTKYDGFEFPIDIPITDYNRYSIEENRPDVIFIHNPYDECNNVTRLPKEYYSSELKKYTKHLVYIPYFVAFSDNIDDDFCVLPGVKNSWRTFVQSEDIRKNYIKYNNADKIVALGSPKIDNIIKLEKNKPEIPKEWEKILGGKKIFLYNTHLSGILNNPEQLIEKLKRVFNCFVGRSDIALLWRPHPLSIATIKSRKLNILNDYLRLIEEYKNMGIGVYDDTKDVGRAMAIADAYIGDNSSLVQMFGVTGKPIFIQEQDIENNSCAFADTQPLFFTTCLYYKSNLYVSADNINAIIKCDLKTKQTEMIGSFGESNSFGKSMGNKMLKSNNIIYIFPWNGSSIIEYNLENNEMKNYYDKNLKNNVYVTGDVYQGKVYMIPWNLNNDILAFDTESKQIVQCGALLNTKLIISDIEVENNYIYIVSKFSSDIIKFNMDNGKCTLFSIGKYNGYRKNLIKDSYLWLLNDDGSKLIKYNKTSGKYKEFCLGENNEYFHMIYANNNIWIFSKDTFEAVCFDINTEQIEHIDLYTSDITMYNLRYKKHGIFIQPIIIENFIMLNSNIADKIIKIDIFTKKIVTEDAYRLPNEWYDEICNKSLNKAKEIYSGEFIHISRYIDAVANDYIKKCEKTENKFIKHIDNSDGTSGEKIWENIYNEINA